jgi:hypothetical protein
MERIKKGLVDVFKVEINPMMEEFDPRGHHY